MFSTTPQGLMILFTSNKKRSQLAAHDGCVRNCGHKSSHWCGIKVARSCTATCWSASASKASISSQRKCLPTGIGAPSSIQVRVINLADPTFIANCHLPGSCSANPATLPTTRSATQQTKHLLVARRSTTFAPPFPIAPFCPPANRVAIVIGLCAPTPTLRS